MDAPQYYYDAARELVMFACPHRDEFTSLPSSIWEVTSIDPLTVAQLVHNACGCNGFIRAGRWIPAGR